MGENQMGFKSPVYRMNIEKMKRTTRSQLRKGDRPWGGAEAKRRQPASEAMQATLWESRQAMNKKSIRGRQGGASWHNTAKSRHSALEVNGTLGRRRFSPLPGEPEHRGDGRRQICPALRPAKAGSVRRGNTSDDRAEVSRGHRSGDVNRGAGKRPIKRRNPQARSAKGRTNIGEPTRAPSQHPNRRQAL